MVLHLIITGWIYAKVHCIGHSEGSRRSPCFLAPVELCCTPLGLVQEVNPDMENFDVVLVMGANDVVNSAAQDQFFGLGKSCTQRLKLEDSQVQTLKMGQY